MLFYSISGGAGSTLGTKISEHLKFQYGKKIQLTFALFPSLNYSSSCVEPFNAALAIQKLNDCGNLNVILDNGAIYKILNRNLNIENPKLDNANKLISHIVSDITSPIRFGGHLSYNLQ
mmetsp:Transcript_13580/g.13325  ORF Transcript_13580/g.13325 Transcript_13580/m.13325 type:complete len:119 (-) Transcript_13580:706-1062(-)